MLKSRYIDNGPKYKPIVCGQCGQPFLTRKARRMHQKAAHHRGPSWVPPLKPVEELYAEPEARTG